MTEGGVFGGRFQSSSIFAAGGGSAAHDLCPQGPGGRGQLPHRVVVRPGAGVWPVRPLWGRGGGGCPPGRPVGCGAGGVFGVPVPLPGVRAHPLRGGPHRGGGHPVVSLRAAGGEYPPPLRPGGGVSAPVPHGHDHGIPQRLHVLHSSPVPGGVLFGGGVRLFPHPHGRAAPGPGGGRPSEARPRPAPGASGGG